jgi:uncharacterized repeat protein (TIGR01451 family)
MTPTRAGSLRNLAVAVAGDGAGAAAEADAVAVATVRTRLRVSTRAARPRVPAGGTVWFTLTVRNTGGHAATDVEVCDAPGARQAFRRTPGATMRRGRACWSVPYLPAGAARRFRVQVRLDADAAGTLASRAVAGAANAPRVAARGPVRAGARPAARVGGVTG